MVARAIARPESDGAETTLSQDDPCHLAVAELSGPPLDEAEVSTLAKRMPRGIEFVHGNTEFGGDLLLIRQRASVQTTCNHKEHGKSRLCHRSGSGGRTGGGGLLSTECILPLESDARGDC